MDKNQIPESIVNYNVYNKNERLLGLASEITLPTFEAMTETISGAGIAGEYETPIPGHFSSQSVEIPFRMLYEEVFELLDPNGTTLILRASQQGYNVIKGIKVYEGLKVTLRVVPKGLDAGKLAVGKMMEAKTTFEIMYIKIEKDSKSLLEYDKLNMIYAINGVDHLEKIRSQI